MQNSCGYICRVSSALVSGDIFDHFIIPTGPSTVKRSSGPTPAPSDHPSRPSSYDARETETIMEECKTGRRAVRNFVGFQSLSDALR